MEEQYPGLLRSFAPNALPANFQACLELCTILQPAKGRGLTNNRFAAIQSRNAGIKTQ